MGATGSDEFDDDGNPVDPVDGVDLAGAAQAGLADTVGEGAGQQALDPGLEYNTHVGFLGMGYRTNDTDYKLGDEVHFLVHGRVKEVGDKLMADEHQRHIVKVDVTSVTTPDRE